MCPSSSERADAVVLAERRAPGLEERLRGDHQDAHRMTGAATATAGPTGVARSVDCRQRPARRPSTRAAMRRELTSADIRGWTTRAIAWYSFRPVRGTPDHRIEQYLIAPSDSGAAVAHPSSAHPAREDRRQRRPAGAARRRERRAAAVGTTRAPHRSPWLAAALGAVLPDGARERLALGPAARRAGRARARRGR